MLTDAQWVAKITELAARPQFDGADHVQVRAALAGAYLLLRNAPQAASQAFERIPEAVIVHRASDLADDFQAGGTAFPVGGGQPTEALVALAVRVRALDRLLSELAPVQGPPGDPNRDYLCAQTDAFVVPRGSPLPVKGGGGSRLGIRRRALVHHRLLARTRGSYTVDLTWLGDASSPKPPILGAAMFSNFELQTDDRVGTFAAKGVKCPTATAQIDRSVSAARGDGCTAIAWPELTMPDPELAILRRTLREKARSSQAPDNLQWVLAGTWPRDRNGRMQNCAPVLDAYGRPVLEHCKSLLFTDAEGRTEAADPSFVISVLVTPEHLVAFAVCKDFLSFDPPNPYEQLDVDLVVVTSMGEKAQMASHVNVAQRVCAGGGRAFVVQQKPSTRRGKPGWVIPPRNAPQSLPQGSLSQPPWSSHEWQSS